MNSVIAPSKNRRAAKGSLCLPDVRMLLGGIGTLDDLDAPLPGAGRLCGAQSW
jgi:hypothetical protein